MSKSFSPRSPATPAIDPRLERALRALLVAGLALVLLLPAARGHNDWLGWMPLWLVGMPAMAWWSLHRFRLPARPGTAHGSVPSLRRRRTGAQARRRHMPVPQRFPRAA
jgi:hypothetical protein